MNFTKSAHFKHSPRSVPDSCNNLARTFRQDQRNVILGTTSTYLGVVITWKFVRTHWDKLVEQNQLTSFTMRRVISACTGDYEVYVTTNSLISTINAKHRDGIADRGRNNRKKSRGSAGALRLL